MDLSRIWHLAIVFCLTCVLVKVIQLHRRRQELLKVLSCFPGPPTHWLYGNISETTGPWIGKNWSLLYPFAFPLWFGNFSACLNITHPDYAKPLLARAGKKKKGIDIWLTGVHVHC
uniref:Cytochrome P450 family 4 subfamily B member 1 n=1 Tax=Podarcis muralis TaxID=64176 RepID=A0A670K412_PODMU